LITSAAGGGEGVAVTVVVAVGAVVVVTVMGGFVVVGAGVCSEAHAPSIPIASEITITPTNTLSHLFFTNILLVFITY
jgi:hypothetical protein